MTTRICRTKPVSQQRMVLQTKMSRTLQSTTAQEKISLNQRKGRSMMKERRREAEVLPYTDKFVQCHTERVPELLEDLE